MSQQLINHSADLKRLRDEGYDLEIKSGYLLVKDVPYVNSRREVKKGILVSELTMDGDTSGTPRDHVIMFIGEYPCHKDGAELHQIKHQSETKILVESLIVNHSFSSKPREGYKNYYEKMTTYAAILSSPAEALDSTATAKTFPVIVPSEEESVFNYLDTASSRAEITAITAKLQIEKIAIVGLGGTGSYILDLVSKTPVQEIHLFDGDKFSNHNAFRSPGAPSVDELREQPKKVVYFQARYTQIHRHIYAHDCYINDSNLDQLQNMNFVFLCLDVGTAKQQIVDKLEEWDIPFIDVGLGVNIVDNALLGIIRTTTSTSAMREHVRQKNRISFTENENNNMYSRNIQIADLNALNAALAVIKWKKLMGFYVDLDKEHFSTYTIDGNIIINDDKL